MTAPAPNDQKPPVTQHWVSRLRSIELSRPQPTGHYARNVVRIGLVMRLVALAAALIGVVGAGLTTKVLIAIVLLSLTSFSVLFFPGAGALMLRHPILVVADSILAFTILALLGPGSPIGLATVLTALILGALFGRVMAVTFGALLLSLYVLALAANANSDYSFMTVLGLPVIYVCFLVVGICARSADEAQRRLSAEIGAEREARAGAEERARLARELHDSVGKSLYGISMLASAASKTLVGDDRVTQQFDLIELSAKEAAGEARSLIELQRADSTDQSFEESLETVCSEWIQRTGVPIEFSWVGQGPVNPNVRHEAVAILLEALENISRHAQASRVRVSFLGDSTGSVLEICDDGAGFDARVHQGIPVAPVGHYGLIGMTERAIRCGALLEIDSQPGQGTSISLKMGEGS